MDIFSTTGVNTQKPEPIINDILLQVHSIFETIQGEGPYAGYPSTFIRLAGCNLQCVWCDTSYTGYTKMSVEEVLSKVKGHKLVVITGGEPLRQKIALLIEALHTKGHLVQIETNGTIYDEDVAFSGATIVVSPKTKNVDKRYLMCDNKHSSNIKFKMLVGPAFPSQPDNKGGNPWDNIKIKYDYVMPLDTGNPRSNAVINHDAVEYCLKHGTKLTIQQHKYLNIE